ncbi:MAG TPA: alpha/beta hydrolase [Chloroflexota bacterium]|nr:alpha/beta hydrolase [Chloroflexota bacterium]
MAISDEREILERPPPPADRRIAYGSAPQQFGDLRLPVDGTGNYPLAIVLHGGFWRAQYDLLHIGHLCAALAARGIATWNVEYRRVDQPGGGWPGTFEDVKAGAAIASTVPELDRGNVVSIGHSAGGHLALWLAAEGAVHGAVSLAGVVDLVEGARRNLGNGAVRMFMGGTPDQMPERYAQASPRARVPLGVPQILIHGELDAVVPIELSRDYQQAAEAARDDVTLHVLAETGHFAVIDPLSHAWPTIENAVARLLHR